MRPSARLRRPDLRRGWSLVAGLLAVLLPALLLGGCSTARQGAVRGGDGLKGLEETDVTASSLRAPTAPQRYALVVGVNEYDDPVFPDLRFAANDANEMARFLEDPNYGGFRHLEVMSGEVSTAEVLSHLRWMRDQLRRDDTLLVYFSGHGTLQLEERGGDTTLYLVTSDTRAGDLAGTAINLTELQSQFRRFEARRKVLIIDACYNGVGKSSLSPRVQQNLANLTRNQGLSFDLPVGESEAHLFAAALGSPARELVDLQHGVYTYHLLQALTWDSGDADINADELISVWEAHDYARTQTIRTTLNEQIPEARMRVVGADDVILAGDPVSRQRADQFALVYHYGGADALAWAGATLSLDGQERGVFPSTVAIPPGPHTVTVRSAEGQTLFHGMLELEAGRSYEANALNQARRSTPWSLRVAAAGRFTLGGEAASLYGVGSAGGEVGLAWQSFGRPARGLTLGVSFAGAPAFAEVGDQRASRAHLALSGQAGWRGDLRDVSLGIGAFGRLNLLTSVADCGQFGLAADSPVCRTWLAPELGVLGEQMFPLGRGYHLYVGEQVGFQLLDPEGLGTPTVSATVRVVVGVELPL